MFVQFEPSWGDRESSWWAKANRAKAHIESLRQQLDDFRAAEPYSLRPEPTEDPDRTAYRLRYHQALPAAIGATIGDVLHNLRAALESLAFEVGRRGHTGAWGKRQEAGSTFPICRSPEEFDGFLEKQAEKWGIHYSPRARQALRSVQPFVILEEAQKHGVSLDKTFEEDYRWNQLHRLDRLWNIDKHRRLTMTTWWPNMIWWTSNGKSNRVALRGDGTLADGSVLLYIQGADEGQGDDLQHEFNLVLTDDPAYTGGEFGATGDVLEFLSSVHMKITDLWVFPRVFTYMSMP